MSPCGLPIERRRALLALVLGTVVLGSCAGGPRITEPPLTAPTVGTPSAQASHGDPSAASRSTEPVSTAVRFALGDWEPVPPAGPLGDVAVNDIIPAGDGYVAVGCEFSAIAEWRECAVPAAWQVGSDGSWSRADVPPARGGSIDVVVRADQGFIAGGQVVLGDPMTETRAAFWTSPDGRRWDRVPDADHFNNARVTDLFAWQGGFVASGLGVYSEAAGVELWRSENGSDWTPILADFGEVLQTGVAPYSGGLILWGPLGGGVCGPCRQTVWLSEDAQTWTRVPDLPTFDGAWFSSIVESGDELVAVGSVSGVAGPGRAAMWSSRDGAEWAPLELEVPPDGDSRVSRVVESEAGPLAVGTYRSTEEPRLVTWVSSPGTQWEWALEPVDRSLPEVDMVAALTAGPEGIIAVLHPRIDLLERSPEVWRRPYLEPDE